MNGLSAVNGFIHSLHILCSYLIHWYRINVYLRIRLAQTVAGVLAHLAQTAVCPYNMCKSLPAHIQCKRPLQLGTSNAIYDT